MHTRKSKKILLYLFLLVILASINNKSLNKLKFDKVSEINISGLNETDNKKILKDIISLNLENLFFLNIGEIIRVMENNSLIQSYKISKQYPSTLNIQIEKTNFLAKTNVDGQVFLIGSNGKLTKSNTYSEFLPFIFGKPKIEEFLKFKKIIDNSNILPKEIKSFYYFKSKRWDIELQNGIVLKLSKENPKNSLDEALLFLNDNNFLKINSVDTRIKNQIIIND